MTALRFANRADAARRLTQHLTAMRFEPPIVVLALPRGGVPIGAAVARALDAELDLLLVRKIGAPWQPELAVAAVVDGERPEVVIDETMMGLAGVDRDYIESQTQHALREIARRRALYLRGRAPAPLAGATVIVVDDGIATGTTVRAALKALRRKGVKRLVLAVPVAPADTCNALRAEVDTLVCLSQPEPFHAIGLHYDDFDQVEDAEVLRALEAPNALP
ncbi:MAG: phosphoribosyltransferase [Burkholderiaceae bacterium]|nr:phosphoribosyltransferase [Burkholderiaceae bacterium]